MRAGRSSSPRPGRPPMAGPNRTSRSRALAKRAASRSAGPPASSATARSPMARVTTGICCATLSVRTTPPGCLGRYRLPQPEQRALVESPWPGQPHPPQKAQGAADTRPYPAWQRHRFKVSALPYIYVRKRRLQPTTIPLIEIRRPAPDDSQIRVCRIGGQISIHGKSRLCSALNSQR